MTRTIKDQQERLSHRGQIPTAHFIPQIKNERLDLTKVLPVILGGKRHQVLAFGITRSAQMLKKSKT